MPRLTITLSESQKAFVDAHVKAGGLRSASAYIAFLIQMEQLKKHQDKIEDLVLEGLNSGPATPMTKQDWAAIRREGLARLAKEKQHAGKRPQKPRRPKSLA
jgi:antitoxin ParD1/3/4